MLLPIAVRMRAGSRALRTITTASGLARLAEPTVREQLASYFKELGFKFVTLDLEGFRSGSLNALVSLESKLRYKTE